MAWIMPCSTGNRALNFALLARDVVDQEILAEEFRAGVKSAAFVNPGHFFNKVSQDRAVVEHEGVDSNSLSGNALRLSQCFLRGLLADSPEAQGPFTVQPPLGIVGGRLAIGDNDHLLIAAGSAL